MTRGRRYTYHKGFIADNALDFSKRSSFIKEILLERVNPTRIILPCKQHYGVSAVPVVRPGDQVKVGQCVAVPPKGKFSLAVHSGISGVVKEIKEIRLPNGIVCPAIHIENDMKMQRVDSIRHRENMNLTAEDVMGIISNAGICGMGGEGIPTAAKIYRAKSHNVNELLVNCLQSEPYATSDLMVLSEYPGYVVMGAGACARAAGASKVVFLISEKRSMLMSGLENAIQNAGRDFADISFEVKLFRERFPQGYFRLVAEALYNVKLDPEDTLEEKCGAVLFNCSTMCACWEAISENIPLMSRVVSITGDVTNGHNVIVPVGTPVSEVLATGGRADDVAGPVVWGNALTGIAIEDKENTPIIKLTSAITVIRKQEQPRTPCIHCGLCAQNCPVGLSPHIIYEMLKQGMPKKAEEEGGRNCISCGICSYICPAGIRLTQRIATFASEGRIIGENSLLHNTRVQYNIDEIGDLSLLEGYVSESEEEEKEDKDAIVLPFDGGKKV
ncbi:electron transport complex protein RnfC [Ruminococcaceae bacterium YRB3002]|nr:electron transport complex protein RnfC [Ruminococcaceae bacterium YRB3002]